MIRQCPVGYRYDAITDSCVPINGQQQQSQQPSMNPMQMRDMLQQFQGGAPGSTQGMAGAGHPGGATGIVSGPQTSSGAVQPGGGMTGWLSNPYAWLAAAIAGTGSALQHNNVSSVPHQLEGDMPNDVIHSPNVQNWAAKMFGNRGARDISDTLRPYTDLHGVRSLKNLPEDSYKSAITPWQTLYHKLSGWL